MYLPQVSSSWRTEKETEIRAPGALVEAEDDTRMHSL